MKPLFLIILLALSTAAHAVPYRNYLGISANSLRSAEGVNISIKAKDYEAGEVGDSQINTAEQIEINILGNNLGYRSTIRAVLIPNCKSWQHGWSIDQATLFVDLVQQENTGASIIYTADFEEAVMTRSVVHSGDQISCQPQLAVEVNGQWLTDPMNGTHNFNLNNF
jgi:hypothetical protein